jgi:hypothetical protein
MACHLWLHRVVRADRQMRALEHRTDGVRKRMNGARLTVDREVHGLVERGVRRSSTAEDGEH